MNKKYNGNELKYLEEALKGKSFVIEFEKRFSEIFNSEYAIAMNSGTSTLHACLESFRFKANSEVIQPALTVIMNTTATLLAGLKPVYADVDFYTFNINPEDIERKITNKTVAIMPVALYGLPCDMGKIKAIADKYNLVVIEDNAQALKVNQSHCASYSLENSKHLSTNEGGVVLTNNEYIAEHIRKIGNHGFKNNTALNGRIKSNPEVYQDPNYERHNYLGWNYRMSEFQAAVGLAQLEQIDEILDARKKSANYYRQAIKDSRIFRLQTDDGYHTYWSFAVQYLKDDWQEFRKEYIKKGGDKIYSAWKNPYKEPVFIKQNLHLSCPIAEELQKRMMQFTTNDMDEEVMKRKADALYKTCLKFN